MIVRFFTLFSEKNAIKACSHILFFLLDEMPKMNMDVRIKRLN